jgi:hypothetical protein
MSEARILNCTLEEYFADPCETPSLSQSIAKVLVTQSPLHAWQEHPRLGGGSNKKATRAMDTGSIVGAILLGTADQVVERIYGFEDFKKKDAQVQRDAAKERGKVPVLDHEFDRLSETALHVAKSFRAFGIEFSGQSEMMLEWTEESTAGPVLCRGMLDHYLRADGVAYDTKSIASAHPDSCQKRMDEMGYDIQWAAYTSAMRKLEPSRFPQLGFLFFETEKPYAVNPIRPSQSLQQLGGLRWERAYNTWGRCMRDNVWPGYANGWNTVAARAWVLARELGEVA